MWGKRTGSQMVDSMAEAESSCKSCIRPILGLCFMFDKDVIAIKSMAYRAFGETERQFVIA